MECGRNHWRKKGCSLPNISLLTLVIMVLYSEQNDMVVMAMKLNHGQRHQNHHNQNSNQKDAHDESDNFHAMINLEHELQGSGIALMNLLSKIEDVDLRVSMIRDQNNGDGKNISHQGNNMELTSSMTTENVMNEQHVITALSVVKRWNSLQESASEMAQASDQVMIPPSTEMLNLN